MATTAKRTATPDLSAEISAAASEYEAAYREYEAVTRMHVPTPEGCGTFGGVWDCDPARLLRALARAIRRVSGACSPAVERAVTGEPITILDWGYGDLTTAPAADLYRMANGLLRDPAGRYLSETERDILEAVVGDWGRAPWACRSRPFAEGSAVRLSATPAEPGSDRHYYYSPGRITQRFVDEIAGSARNLTKSYLVGWPVCTGRQKLDAYRRVRDIYRGLAADYAASA